jgi:redox-sensitive bicupin YhaK (pirin superfamily)
MTEVEIFPAAGRSVTHGPDAGAARRAGVGGSGGPAIETRHSFAFGAHYDPKNTGFGLLVAHNDENLAPGAGFDMHPHHDSEIVTWVVEGTVRHIDSLGNDALLGAGTVQWQGAGSGIVHSERNASTDQTARFIQVWLTPDDYGLAPGYASAQVKLAPNVLTLVAGGGGAGGQEDDGQWDDTADPVLRFRQRHAALYAARLEAGGSIELPASAYTHIFVISGVVRIGPGALEPGDAARITGEGARLECLDDAEVLVWRMNRSTRDMLTGVPPTAQN